jgi:hypothetical protein
MRTSRSSFSSCADLGSTAQLSALAPLPRFWGYDRLGQGGFEFGQYRYPTSELIERGADGFRRSGEVDRVAGRAPASPSWLEAPIRMREERYWIREGRLTGVQSDLIHQFSGKIVESVGFNPAFDARCSNVVPCSLACEHTPRACLRERSLWESDPVV